MEQVQQTQPPVPQDAGTRGGARICTVCGQQISGKFVRALNGHYHLECFRCHDCNQIVAEKFFPMDMGTGRQEIFCEYDYFKRLNLLCSKCNTALRGPHITALGKKFHLEHFTCSVCPTVFKQNDQYYERDGQVYCKTHYSILFAQKCGGCRCAVLKNFVEMSRHGELEQWHPECYMVYKFWKIKFATPKKPASSQRASQDVNLQDAASMENAEEELKRQQALVEKVKKVLTFVSAFEESSAESISNMLIYFSNLQYQEGILQAAKFICHIEVLFVSLDEIESKLARYRDSIGFDHSKEPKQLARKIVHFFSLLSKNQSAEAREEATKELISLVTYLARLLKILIRYSLTGALKLEQKYMEACIPELLSRLVSLGESRDGDSEENIIIDLQYMGRVEHCLTCGKSVEQKCVKFLNNRWHLECFQCSVCACRLDSSVETSHFDTIAKSVYCEQHKSLISRTGFEHVTQLEQYVFLLRCALSRLCSILNVRIDTETVAAIDSEPVSEKMKEILTITDDDLGTGEAQLVKTQMLPQQQPKNLIPMLPSQSAPPVMASEEVLLAASSMDQLQFNSNNPSLSSYQHHQLMSPGLTRLAPETSDSSTAAPSDTTRQRASHQKPLAWLAELDAFGSRVAGVIAIQRLQQIFVPKYLTQDEFLACVETGKSTSVLKKITEAFKVKKGDSAKYDGTFGVALEVHVERYPAKLDYGYGPNPKTVPFIIADTIRLMQSLDLRVEGIFRKNGNIKRLKTATESFDEDPYTLDLAEDNQIQLAALMKKYLRELPEPLMTYKLHKLWVTVLKLESERQRKEALHYICCLLPRPNLELLSIILFFLEYVSRFSEDQLNPDGSVRIPGNKMDLENICTCVAPNLLYSRSKNPVDDDSFSAIAIVSMMIKWQEDLWKIPDYIRSQVLRQLDISDDANESNRTSDVDTYRQGRQIVFRNYEQQPMESTTRIENS